MESNGYAILAKDDIRLQMARMYTKVFFAPEGYFDNELLYHFNAGCRVLLHCLCDRLCHWIDGKPQGDLLIKKKDLPSYDDKEYEAINEVYREIWEKVKSAKNGVIFDATHYTKKSRKMYIAKFRGRVLLKARYFDCTLEQSKENNDMRFEREKIVYKDKEYGGRRVPDHALENMFNNMTIPNTIEGFDEVYLDGFYKHGMGNNITELTMADIYNNFDRYTEDDIGEKIPCFKECINFNQDNEHHQMTLSKHMYTTAKYVKEHGGSLVLFTAALLHDVGKINTKGFYGRLTCDYEGYKAHKELQILNEEETAYKCLDPFNRQLIIVEKEYLDFDKDAHYYGHHISSALKAWQDLYKSCTPEFTNAVYQLIYHHMDLPFKTNKITNKTKNNLIKYVGFEGLKDLALLREADLFAKDGIYRDCGELVNNIKNYNYESFLK
jgi:predicted HD phosphohydrolase